MNGSPSGPANAGAAPNADDLDSVLGRFQEWAKARGQQPSAKFGSTASLGRGKAPKKVDLTHGARELSYEQALRASSYRHPAFPATNEDSARAPNPVQIPMRNTREVNLESEAREDSPPERAKHPDKRLARASHPDESRAAGRTRAKRTASTPARQKRTLRSPPSAPSAAPPGPVFREVFQKTPGLAALSRTASMLENKIPENKSIALSLRVSDIEQTRIQAGAARANLSVSAYLRQCALGVDELRGQVELALSALHKQDTKPQATPGMKDIPGILGRFASHWFGRMRDRHDFTGLSLR